MAVHGRALIMHAPPPVQGVATASQIASITNGKVTVLIVDEEGTTSSNPTERLDSLNW